MRKQFLIKREKKMDKGRRGVQMGIFIHHIYEYKKGLRKLILCAMNKSLKENVEAKLKREGIDFIIYPIRENIMNVFFGDELCVRMVKTINKECLRDYTAEEDFILGTMLGYDMVKQCERYIRFKEKKSDAIKLESEKVYIIKLKRKRKT